MTKTLIFFVPGLPQPAGSKRGFALRKNGVLTGRVAISDANSKAKPWQAEIKAAAAAAMAANEIGQAVSLFSGPVSLKLDFTMPRPKGHFGSGKNASQLKPNSPKFHTVKPDALKLARAVEDALTGIVWRDDSQICIESIRKHYLTEPIGCLIEVSEVCE